MAAGRPARYHDPLPVAAKRGQLRAEKIDAGMDLRDNLVERRIRRERIAGQRDIDAMRQRSFGEQRKIFLGAHLPIAAMNEEQRWRAFRGLEKVDPVALARAVAKVEMAGMALAQLGRA